MKFLCPVFALFLLFLNLHGEEKASNEEFVGKSPAKKALLEMVKTPEDSEGLIQLPLRVRLITNLELNRKKVKMQTWVTPKEFEETILPELNRIWKPANIQWVLESIAEQPAPNLPNRQELITYIENSKRNTPEKSYPKRTINILRLCNRARGHAVVHNLYLFPYLGQTFQGFANMRGNHAVITTWTDKPFRAKKPPIKFQLAEEPPFKTGSIARTCSHELGHNLGLQHPDKKTQTHFNRLMGGKKHGYDLTSEEIKSARKIALKRAQAIREWATR